MERKEGELLGKWTERNKGEVERRRRIERKEGERWRGRVGER